ncbi:flagellar hook-basal body complex protein FliE [Bacillus sp. ISL-47]|uniref:flagellar hook-basal body complex protein FliE n=1 Tax=Bacillus sp. ISL-47 TaxID=2819130 RepID=UPI001BE797F2|nr:flagellar hook-basal body complex protein FliE [Bacillus sp. ISL-47]MBT2688553.1 flagellar hook-basal body complex protein FliE [Bacillus sp. ISL-47]MBT2708851.1 flagellar hook-basal body complex protein FliE [Pseudomonas sp. ISL-84]
MNKVTFNPVHSLKQTENAKTHTYTTFEAQQSFSSVLKQSIEKINEAQIQSDVMTEKLARGENIDLHQVMITSQKASITMQAALEVRNKVIEAYQEAMRMQV